MNYYIKVFSELIVPLLLFSLITIGITTIIVTIKNKIITINK